MNKSISYLCLIFILTVFTSCSKDDSQDNSIQGTWKLTSWTLKTPIDLNNDGVSSSIFDPGCLNGSELKFIDNSTGTLFFSSIVSYNTSNENGTLVFMTSCSTDSELSPSPITYIQDGEKLVITDNNEEFVLIRDGNTLSMLIPSGFKASASDTFEPTVSQDITYIFSKQ